MYLIFFLFICVFYLPDGAGDLIIVYNQKCDIDDRSYSLYQLH